MSNYHYHIDRCNRVRDHLGCSRAIDKIPTNDERLKPIRNYSDELLRLASVESTEQKTNSPHKNGADDKLTVFAASSVIAATFMMSAIIALVIGWDRYVHIRSTDLIEANLDGSVEAAVRELGSIRKTGVYFDDLRYQYDRLKYKPDFYGGHGNKPEYKKGREGFRTLREIKDTIYPGIPDTAFADHTDPVLDRYIELMQNAIDAQRRDEVHNTIVEKPSAEQLRRIALLREYAYRVIGVAQNFDIVLFTNNGGNRGLCAGVSHPDPDIDYMIAFNTNVIDNEFDDALAIIIHEIAHTSEMRLNGRPITERTQHSETSFMRALESMLTLAARVNREIAQKLQSGAKLNENERRILEIPKEWSAR